MEKIKKISLKKHSEFLSEKEMKYILGGSLCGGTGTCSGVCVTPGWSCSRNSFGNCLCK